MHNNYYFLRQLSGSLEKILTGTVVSECFSQNKDELVLRLETHSKPFFVKASLLPNFSCLSFPDHFHRARKNSVDLFSALIGQRILDFRQFENERSFAVQFTNNLQLLFKMHGNHANIILLDSDVAVDLFKNGIQADWDIKLQQLDRNIDWGFENFTANEDRLQALYFTFGKLVWQYLEEKNFSTSTTAEKWEMIQSVRQLLENPTFNVNEVQKVPVLSLLPDGKNLKTFKSPIDAVNSFFFTYTHTYAFTQERAAALATMKGRLQSSKNYYQKTLGRLQELEQDNNYKVWADLLMANLHAIEPNAEKVTLENFYHQNLPVEIKLKRQLSAQKNAEVFYKKSKNQQIEVQRLRQLLKTQEALIISIEEKIAKIESAAEFTELRKLKKELQLESAEVKVSEPLPYYEFSFNNFRIWVGKNAQHNDALTLKYAYKEDLWLHAKDVPGSHVVIKHQAGKNFPKDVIERAAQLAAYNSKRKNDSLCPVVVTPRKFVRKRKGDPPGAVVVEREDIILVEPKL
ncbi:MAG: NFACT RNA binding domain-containing protein [Bacteroidota bacterium]